MSQSEAMLAREWVKNLTRQVSERVERIKITNIHGDAFQETVSDYICCYKGRFIAIEFKIHPNTCTDRQMNFLVDVLESGGVAMIVEFHKRPAIAVKDPQARFGYNQDGYFYYGQELASIIKAMNETKDLIYKFVF